LKEGFGRSVEMRLVETGEEMRGTTEKMRVRRHPCYRQGRWSNSIKHAGRDVPAALKFIVMAASSATCNGIECMYVGCKL
jgi:hypothetical protein